MSVLLAGSFYLLFEEVALFLEIILGFNTTLLIFSFITLVVKADFIGQDSSLIRFIPLNIELRFITDFGNAG